MRYSVYSLGALLVVKAVGRGGLCFSNHIHILIDICSAFISSFVYYCTGLLNIYIYCTSNEYEIVWNGDGEGHSDRRGDEMAGVGVNDQNRLPQLPFFGSTTSHPCYSRLVRIESYSWSTEQVTRNHEQSTCLLSCLSHSTVTATYISIQPSRIRRIPY